MPVFPAKGNATPMWTKAMQVGVISTGLLLIGSGAQAAQTWDTSNNSGIANGNQVHLPIQLPINVCGNAAGILGNASAGCTGGATATYDNGALEASWTSIGNSGIGNGNQVNALIQIPVNICGNAIGILGDANAWCTGGSTAKADKKAAITKKARGYTTKAGTCELNWTTMANSGLANGNQIFLPLQAPIDVSGNAAAVGGNANASSTGGAKASFC